MAFIIEFLLLHSVLTGLQYAWYKDPVFGALRPDINPNIFISQNGNLYLSQVLSDDAGNYYCIVAGKGSTVSKTSMPIALQVTPAGKITKEF